MKGKRGLMPSQQAMSDEAWSWLAKAPGLPAAVQKAYKARAQKAEDQAELIGKLEAKVKSLEAALEEAQTGEEQLKKDLTQKVMDATMRTLGVTASSLVPAKPSAGPPPTLANDDEASDASGKDEASDASGKDEASDAASGEEAAGEPRIHRLGLEFYNTGCSNGPSFCICKVDGKGRCTTKSTPRAVDSDSNLEILWVQVLDKEKKIDYALHDWASKYGSKKVVGVCSHVPSQDREQVKAARRQVMQHLHRAFTELHHGETPMVRFWKRHKDPKYEFVRLFERIERDASQSTALLVKAIPLPDDAETPGPTKKQKFK